MNANLHPPFRGWSRAEESQKHGSGGENTPRLGLVLSSGGSRGLAHAGVIQVLEENAIPIAAVAGCSMGAYVGALWAAGLDGKALEERAREIKDRATFKKLLDFIVPPSEGLIRGEKIRQHLERDLGKRTFHELGRELIVIATDLDRLAPHVFSSGQVSHAVHASAAIPAICAPVHLDGRRYTDGGATEPLPVRLLKQHCAVDHVIAVNVMPAQSDFESGHDTTFGTTCEVPQNAASRLLRRLWRKVNLLAHGNVLDTFRRSLMAAQLRLIVKEEAAASVVIHPRFTASNWHDFENFGHYLQAGRVAAIAALPAIRELLSQSNPTPLARHETRLEHHTA
jgi:NTE family protein